MLKVSQNILGFSLLKLFLIIFFNLKVTILKNNNRGLIWKKNN